MNTTPSLTLPNVTPDKLTSLQHDLHTRKDLLRQIISTFEARYECSLVELERGLENLEIPGKTLSNGATPLNSLNASN
jgi:hypothetical protein